jgi:hypothetical protein
VGAGLTAPVVGIAPTPDNGGYWLAESNGGSLRLGDAANFGNLAGQHLNAPMVNEGD